MTAVVYTAALGVPPPPRPLDPRWSEDARFVCARLRGEAPAPWPWATVFLDDPGPDARRALARQVKAAPWLHGIDAEQMLWHDAKCRIVVHPNEILGRLTPPRPIWFTRHPDRMNVASESAAVVKLRYASPEAVRKQLSAYAAEGFPDERLTVTTYLARLDNDQTREWGLIWARELASRGHDRDQLSVDYALWKAGIEPSYLPGIYRDNPHVLRRRDGFRPIGRWHALTPTGDRPETLALTARWLARQALRPARWLIVDDGRAPTPPAAWAAAEAAGIEVLRLRRDPRDSGTAASLARNVIEGLPLAARGADAVAIFEDDDWYGPEHLLRLDRALEDGADLAGTPVQRYYHLPSRAHKTMANVGACLAGTGLRVAEVPALLRSALDCLDRHLAGKQRAYGVDGGFWREALRDRKDRCAVSEAAGQTLGLKGLPGRAGLGVGHRPGADWEQDPDAIALRRWIGREDAEAYLGLLAPSATA